MRKIAAFGAALLLSSASAQVMGQALSLPQTGICEVFGCKNLKTVQVTPRIKYVAGERQELTPELGGSAFGMYVDGRLAMLGWQEGDNFDTLNPKFGDLNRLAKLFTGIGAPPALKTRLGEVGLPMQGNYLVRGAVMHSFIGGGLRTVAVTDQRHYALLRNLVGRNDAAAAQAIIERGLRASGLSYQKVGGGYRISPTTATTAGQLDRVFAAQNLRKCTLCDRHFLRYFLPAFSGTQIDVNAYVAKGQTLQMGDRINRGGIAYMDMTIEKLPSWK